MRSPDLALFRLREQLRKMGCLEVVEILASFHGTTLVYVFSSAEPTTVRRDVVRALLRGKVPISIIADWFCADAEEMIILMKTDGTQHKRLANALDSGGN